MLPEDPFLRSEDVSHAHMGVTGTGGKSLRLRVNEKCFCPSAAKQPTLTRREWIFVLFYFYLFEH